MLLALKPPSLMQHDIKTSPRLGHIHDYSTSAHSYKPTHNNTTFSRYSPPDSPRHLPSFFTNGATPAAATNGDTAMSSGSGHGHSYTHQPPPPPPASSHPRGLPPPSSAGFSLPPPTPVSADPHYRSSSAAPLQPPAQPQSQHHGLSSGSTMGTLPAPPSSWSTSAASNDEAMRNWLHAKIEEDRRKQEEEKTRQENLKLDRRRMERDMLHESLERGIPPVMVPLIFAGIGTGSETTLSQAMEFAQTWMQNFSIQQQTPSSASDAQRLAYEQQLRQQGSLLTSASSPDIRRERDQRELRDRMIPPNPYGAQQQAPHSSDRASFRASFSGAQSGALSKLNTVDFAPPAQHRQPLHSTHSASDLRLRSERDDLPSAPSASTLPTGTTSSTTGQGSASGGGGGGAALFFHHWTPPTGGGASSTTSAPPTSGTQQQPPTPSTKSMQGSPFGSQGSTSGGPTNTSSTHGHLRKQAGPSAVAVSDVYENSPKKRKTAHNTPGPSQPGSGSSAGGGSGPVSQGALAAVRAQVAQEEEEMARRGGGGDPTGRRGSEEGSDRGRAGQPQEDVGPLRPSSRQLRREEEEHHQHHAQQYQHHQQQGGSYQRYESEPGRPPDR
ncbi:uncharacterized protein AB675_8278 [Cyphellophora attinorum]|uniref:Uncharacterized protein n=1 Tax=Cyphellophora attinorum TaxID=1664694 RepID=A0A0N1H9P9_9EURO|nr:uncharacterized protein AB675_8278 [Phialophora attinorum]KPI44342.1 hypothetical protein AB675_8278 [Phialophora attinorum]